MTDTGTTGDEGGRGRRSGGPWQDVDAGVVEIDRNGLEILGRDECLQLLRHARLGRIGVTISALPVVLPVNFRLVGDRVLFRTTAGTKLAAATLNSVVAFEVDDMEPFGHTGWSVVVTGLAREVTDPGELAEVATANIPHWAPVAGDHVVEISTDMISGRRIGPRPRPATTG
jgi:nitroimidazol reductase NimA-like FMN-containing flavoprotein (pyridoxamine 5'-phosphate oxidase superfamily)